MIYGLIPVGGKGTRLGLPFSKEMLPLKGYEDYYPVCKLTVDNMLSAGCQKIFFIHGFEYKTEIINLFNQENFVHIKNLSERQSEVFSSFYNSVVLKDNDIFLYGLPDSFYKKNLFPQIKNIDGLVCGMYKIDDDCKVGRLNIITNKFVKSVKEEDLTDYCWGVLKFDLSCLKIFNEEVLRELNNNLIYLNNFEKYGNPHCADCFAFSGSHQMNVYSNTYDNILLYGEEGVVLAGEAMLYKQLLKNNIKLKKFDINHAFEPDYKTCWCRHSLIRN